MFTASNETQIRPGKIAGIHIDCSGGNDVHDLSDSEEQALREYFQQDRDEKLGRWRWPADSRFVVYPGYSPGEEERFVRVVEEYTGISTLVYESQKNGVRGHNVATAYFEAHPERKPWHSPEPGDHWALHIAHGMALADDFYLYKFTRWMDKGFRFVPTEGGSVLEPTDPSITAARRIWPEQSDA